jgi:glycine/serine hydroxymethyltransferase
VVFPFLYFMIGKSRGIKAAVASLTSDNRAWIHDMPKPVLTSGLEKFRVGSEAGTYKGTKRVRAKAMASFVSKRLDQTEGLPRPLRWLVKSILMKLKVARLIEEMNELKKNGGSDEAVTAQLRVRIDREIDERMKIGWGAPGVLLLVNAVFAGAVYWFVRG